MAWTLPTGSSRKMPLTIGVSKCPYIQRQGATSKEPKDHLVALTCSRNHRSHCRTVRVPCNQVLPALLLVVSDQFTWKATPRSNLREEDWTIEADLQTMMPVLPAAASSLERRIMGLKANVEEAQIHHSQVRGSPQKHQKRKLARPPMSLQRPETNQSAEALQASIVRWQTVRFSVPTSTVVITRRQSQGRCGPLLPSIRTTGSWRDVRKSSSKIWTPGFAQK